MFTTKKEVDKHVRTTLSKLRTDNEKNLRGVTISKMYFKLGEYSSALQYVCGYLQVKNDSAQAYKLQGECYEKLNKIDKALKSYQQSLHLEPKQFDLLSHACKLVLANENLLSSGQAQFWHDFATAQNCQHESVLNLKLRILNRDNADPKQAEDLILREIMARQTDVSLRVRLVKHYLSQNRVPDAFRYVYDIEMKQNEFFAQSLDWYNAVSLVVAKCNGEQKTKWPYWLLSVMTLERQCFLKLCTVEVMRQQQQLNLSECANLLFEFDQTLSTASSVVLAVCAERELAAQFLHHYRGQLCLHAATFLLKRERVQQSQNRDATINALALLLVAYNCGIASKDEPWLRNSSEATKQLIGLWNQEGAFRCSQSGRTLLSCIDDDRQNNVVMATMRKICTDWTTRDELVNQVRRVSTNTDWRKNLFRMLFGGRDHAGKPTNSHLLKCTEMDDLNYELPRVSELDTYEECAQWLRPSSLAQMVYLCIGSADISQITCPTFNVRNLSIPNLLSCGAETLNQLDIDTFLYAATIQAKRYLEMERTATETVNNGTNSIKPKMLPFANISAMLATDEQSNWWTSAYKVCKNISGDDLAEVRQQLQYGIEAIRGVGGPKMDTIICLKLGQVFAKRSTSSIKLVERGFLDARTFALYKFGLHMIKKQNSRSIDTRLFKYATNNDIEAEKEVDNLAEEAVAYVAQHYFTNNELEGCIDELSHVQLPSATYYIAQAYRRKGESNETPKKNKRIYEEKAFAYLQQTLTLMDHLNVDQNRRNPLRDMVVNDMKSLQQQSASFNGSFTNGNPYVDVSLNESSFSHRQRRETTLPPTNTDDLERLMKQMLETLTFVKEDVSNVRSRMDSMEDKICQIEEQLNRKQDVNNVDPTGLDEFLNMDAELQAHGFLNNASMFPNHAQQRIQTPQMHPGMAVAQQSILNPYSNQYYNNAYQMGMNQYQAAILTPHRTPLVIPQQIPYADMTTYNQQLTDPRGSLIGLLTQQQQQQPVVQPQGAIVPNTQTNAVPTMPPMQTLPQQPQVTPVLPTFPTVTNSTDKPQPNSNIVRTWNSSFNNTPIEKAPPVNVVITNSEPLPTIQSTVTSQPALSVTIPSHHIKNTIAPNEPSNQPQIATTAAQSVIDFSKKDVAKTTTPFNPLSSTPISSVTAKAKESTETTKPNPFANFSFGSFTSTASVKPTEQSALKSVEIENKTDTANAKDEEDDYVPTAEFAPLIALPDLIEVKTGEEEEIIKFEHRAKLLRYVKESKEWKERGVGNMKVLVNRNDANKVRLLMRREQVLKLCCNQLIGKETKFSKLPKLETALSWFGQDFSENELTTELLAVRFKTAETCNEFHSAILDAQKNMTDRGESKTAEPKTAEPKTSVKENKESTKGKGFGDQFKPVAGSWNCEICYVSNIAGTVQCVACNTPKDKPATAPATPATTKAAATSKVDNGFGNKFKPQPGAWECKLCYISNKAGDIYCLACESPKDDTVPKKEPKNLLSSLTTSSTPKFSFGVPIASTTAAATTTTNPASSTFSFGTFTAMTTNTASATPSFGATLGQPKPGGFTFGGLTASSPFAVTPVKDVPVKSEPSSKLEQKENFSFVFKPKSPGKAKSPLKSVDGVEDISDDENIEEENSTYFTPVIALPDKVEVKTGEEDEEVLYSHRSKLFRFADGEWKERGLGDVKILRHQQSGKLRVVMRREQILKICLNHVLNEEVEYKVKDDKSWHFIVNDFSEGEVELMQFCLRFKTPEVAQEFRQAVRDALAGNSTVQTSNGFDDKVTDEEKTRIVQLKLPAGFYNQGKECGGCRGCNCDDFVFGTYTDNNSVASDDNPLPLKQPNKKLSTATVAKPTLTSFGQLSKAHETSRNIFGTANSSSSDQGLFTQKSFTPNAKDGGSLFGTANESGSLFGNKNIFGGMKTIFPTSEEPKVTTTPADEVKKNFSFTNSLKPSVFGQNIFGQGATATFGNNASKSNDDAGSAAKAFSFGDMMRNTATTTPPATNSFSFAEPAKGDDFKVNDLTATNSTTPSDKNIFGGTPLFGSSSLNPTNNLSSSKFTFTSPSSSSNNNANSVPLRDNGLSFAALARSTESTPASNAEIPFKVDSSLSFASLASQSTQPFTSPVSTVDPKQGFFGLSNENAFSSFQRTAANDSKDNDNSNADDSTYDPHYDPIIPLPDEIVVRTGEEDEEKLFGERGKLYRYDATTKEWKERGVGEVKILYHPTNDTYRFLLRREQIFKCVLNHQLSADLCVNPMKSSEKAFAWAAHNHGEDSNGELEQLSVRFKNIEIATKFIDVVKRCVNKLKAKGDGLEPEDD